MKVDIYLEKGYSHFICEDYIRYDKDLKMICLSDGCSSSPDTDIGARIMVIGMLNNFCSWHDLNENKFIENIFDYDSLLITGEKNQMNSLDATAVVYNPDLEEVVFFGDGVFFNKDKEGKINIYQVEYESGAPFYLSYNLSKNRRNHYFEEFKDKKKYLITNGIKVEVPVEDSVILNNINNIEIAGIASDGLLSYIKKNESISVETIVNDVLDFKSFNGEFLKRRMNKINKIHKKEGITHYDDVSIGIAYFGDNKNE